MLQLSKGVARTQVTGRFRILTTQQDNQNKPPDEDRSQRTAYQQLRTAFSREP
jgi:hypothetical protein